MGCFSSKPAEQNTNEERMKLDQASPTRVVNSVPTSNAPAAVPVPRAKVEITEADKAKHKLKHQRDSLARTLKQSEMVLQRDLKMASQLKKEGNKESALVLLRRRKLVQQRVKVTSAQLGKIEQSIDNLEGAENLKAVLDAVEEGTNALNKLNAFVNIERAEAVMEESRNALAYTDEVAAVLAEVDDMPELDEDEVLKEIEEFERATGDNVKETLGDNVLHQLPETPANKLPEQSEVVVEESAPIKKTPVAM